MFLRISYPFALSGDILNILLLTIIYFLLRQTSTSNRFRELIPLGIMLLFFTFPGQLSILLEIWVNQRWFFWESFSSLGMTPDTMEFWGDISHLAHFLVLSIGCIISGCYSILNGFKILENQG